MGIQYKMDSEQLKEIVTDWLKESQGDFYGDIKDVDGNVDIGFFAINKDDAHQEIEVNHIIID